MIQDARSHEIKICRKVSCKGSAVHGGSIKVSCMGSAVHILGPIKHSTTRHTLTVGSLSVCDITWRPDELIY
jgi:hypothetical protein